MEFATENVVIFAGINENRLFYLTAILLNNYSLLKQQLVCNYSLSAKTTIHLSVGG